MKKTANTVAFGTLSKRLVMSTVLVFAGSVGLSLYQDSNASAAGWTTVSEQTVNKKLVKNKWQSLGKFTMKNGKTYRYCVLGSGDGVVNLQPEAFGTTVQFRYSNGMLQQSLCTKSFKKTASSSVGKWEASALFIGYINPDHTKPITIKKFTLQVK